MASRRESRKSRVAPARSALASISDGGHERQLVEVERPPDRAMRAVYRDRETEREYVAQVARDQARIQRVDP